MSVEDHLTPLPFDEPWQAEVFALTTHLNESGLFTWPDWAERFGKALKESEEPIEGGHDYYTTWLIHYWLCSLNLAMRRQMKLS